MELEHKTCFVAGLGVTGLAVAGFLSRRGARVTAGDRAEPVRLGNIVNELTAMGVAVVGGSRYLDPAAAADLIVVSPGVPHTLAPFARAREKGIPVIGEIELAARFIREPIIAVTGTNGKTTVTTLIGRMLAASGLKVFVGGNIGNPLIEYVEQRRRADAVVIEVSSFQLDTIERFRPRVGVLLNISADHLDRYADMDAYAASKGRLFRNQDKADVAVLNGLDPLVMAVAAKASSRRLVYGRQEPQGGGAWLLDDEIRLDSGAGVSMALPAATLPLAGGHNRENIAAAALAALAAGATAEGLRRALAEFKGLPHRLEHVATVDGIRFCDDSKATNVDAVQRALESFASPVVLIMGGRDKGGSYDVLKPLVAEKVRALVVIGEACEKIMASLGGAVPAAPAASMAEAVGLARRAARPGDTVLLSPACSSFDMFDSYAHRGRVFAEAVKGLKGA